VCVCVSQNEVVIANVQMSPTADVKEEDRCKGKSKST